MKIRKMAAIIATLTLMLCLSVKAEARDKRGSIDRYLSHEQAIAEHIAVCGVVEARAGILSHRDQLLAESIAESKDRPLDYIETESFKDLQLPISFHNLGFRGYWTDQNGEQIPEADVKIFFTHYPHYANAAIAMTIQNYGETNGQTKLRYIMRSYTEELDIDRYLLRCDLEAEILQGYIEEQRIDTSPEIGGRSEEFFEYFVKLSELTETYMCDQPDRIHPYGTGRLEYINFCTPDGNTPGCDAAKIIYYHQKRLADEYSKAHTLQPPQSGRTRIPESAPANTPETLLNRRPLLNPSTTEQSLRRLLLPLVMPTATVLPTLLKLRPPPTSPQKWSATTWIPPTIRRPSQRWRPNKPN